MCVCVCVYVTTNNGVLCGPAFVNTWLKYIGIAHLANMSALCSAKNYAGIIDACLVAT